MTLPDLITEANELGWHVTLRQHPDKLNHWECVLMRRAEQIVNGQVRELIRAYSHSAFDALDQAVTNSLTEEPSRLVPMGYSPDAVGAKTNLSDLLGAIAAPALPTITRRF